MNLIHISWAGPDLLITDLDGREWRFEMAFYGGPFILGKDGEVLEDQPGDRSPFWKAFNPWQEQGKRVEDGRCIYDKPPLPPELVNIGGRNWAEKGSELAKRFGK